MSLKFYYEMLLSLCVLEKSKSVLLTIHYFIKNILLEISLNDYTELNFEESVASIEDGLY